MVKKIRAGLVVSLVLLCVMSISAEAEGLDSIISKEMICKADNGIVSYISGIFGLGSSRHVELTDDMIENDVKLTSSIDNLYCCGNAYYTGFYWMQPTGEKEIDIKCNGKYNTINFKVSYAASVSDRYRIASVTVIADGKVVKTSCIDGEVRYNMSANINNAENVVLKIKTKSNNDKQYSKLTLGDVYFE